MFHSFPLWVRSEILSSTLKFAGFGRMHLGGLAARSHAYPAAQAGLQLGRHVGLSLITAQVELVGQAGSQAIGRHVSLFRPQAKPRGHLRRQ